MDEQLYRIECPYPEDMTHQRSCFVPVEIDDEAARNAYIDGRVAVAAKLITGTPMEPHDEAAFVLTMVFNAALGLEGDADE